MYLLFQGHTNCVNCLRFSPDGRWIASAGEDGLIKVSLSYMGLVATKPVFGVSKKLRLKPVSSAKETS